MPSDTPLSVLARDFEFGFVRLVLAHGEITMSSVVVVGARAVCFNWRAHEEEQRARVSARGQSLADACGMRTQNWPIPWGVGVERHNRATTARTYDDVFRRVAGTSLICSFEFVSSHAN